MDTGAFARYKAWSGSLTTASLVTPHRVIPFGRACVIDDSLRRRVYAVQGRKRMSTHKRARSGDGRERLPRGLSRVNLNAAGIDVGASSHFAAVSEECSDQVVREFEALTADLYRLADWLAECGVETVVMESTGVYWIPLFGVLEERGLPGDAGGPQTHQERAQVARPMCWTASGCNGCIPTDCCREPSVPTGKSDVCAVICGSGPCWCSTRPITSNICRRR